MIAWCWLVSPVVVTARLPLPVCSIRPWLLSVSVVRLTCPALRVPVLVVVVLVMVPCERALISPLLVKLLLSSCTPCWLLAMVPLLVMALPLTFTVAPSLAPIKPVLVRLPWASKLKLLLALISPALVTPKPLSVPIRRILPAYIPPRLETSKATPVAWLVAAGSLWVIWVLLASLS